MLITDQVLQERYRILGVMGQGGMGAVYRALEIQLGIECVIKEMLLPTDAALIEPAVAQFKREAKTLAGLRHPNLPRVSHYFEQNGNYYLVMDLIAGQGLDKLIGTTGLPESQVLGYADQLLDVLVYIHERGVLHRDIKPANIIIQPDGRAVLVDFGLAKVVDGVIGSRSLIGLTPHYAPPEQYTGNADQRSDLFSLAAMLYQALTGQLPTSFSDQSSGERLIPLRQLRPAISERTETVIMRTLTLDRTRRYQTAAEMRAALNGAAAAVPAPAVSSKAPPIGSSTILFDAAMAPGTPMRPPAARLRRPWMIASAVVIAVAVLGILGAIIVPRLAGTEINTGATVSPDQLTLTLTRGVTLDLVQVPTGDVLMGSVVGEKDTEDDEAPQHKLHLGGFLIGKYTVTNAQFAAFVAATGYKTTAEKDGSGYTFNGSEWKEMAGASWQHPKGPDSDLKNMDQYPVILVTWDDAVAFCKWASETSGRQVSLPTEAQWERTARDGDARLYPWGNTPDPTRANYENRANGITPAGKYSPAGDSPFGAADMAGNVWQWTSSLFRPYPYKADDGREDTFDRDPRVLRGGGFDDVRAHVRSANRYSDGPKSKVGNYSFRVTVALSGSK